MEKELKEYLRRYHNMSESDIANIERTATEEQLNVFRKDMQFISPLQAIADQIQQDQEAAQERARRQALQKVREKRARKRSQFALGLGFIPLISILAMLFGTAIDWFEEATAPTDLTAVSQSAQVYLEMGVSSRQLAEQMVLEGCSASEAQAIVDNCDADWNEQAVLAAKGHRQYSDMSEEELLEMLIFQGFTEEQAAYGVRNSQ